MSHFGYKATFSEIVTKMSKKVGLYDDIGNSLGVRRVPALDFGVLCYQLVALNRL